MSSSFLSLPTENCQLVFPSSVSYRTGSLQNSAVDDVSNCNESTQVTFCMQPIVITDSSLGPENYDASGSSYYLLNNRELTQILFDFPRDVLLSTIQLHYYFDVTNEVALPKMRISLVENFQVSQTLSSSIRSLTIDPIDASPELNGRSNITARLAGEFSARTTQILLRIEDNKDYSLALSEIKFCENGEFRLFLECMSHIRMPLHVSACHTSRVQARNVRSTVQPSLMFITLEIGALLITAASRQHHQHWISHSQAKPPQHRIWVPKHVSRPLLAHWCVHIAMLYRAWCIGLPF